LGISSAAILAGQALEFSCFVLSAPVSLALDSSIEFRTLRAQIFSTL
jgi:hypothetical protein